MAYLGKADKETKAFLERQFGGGSILFGQKRPSSSKQNSEPARNTSDEKVDPALWAMQESERRLTEQDMDSTHSIGQTPEASQTTDRLRPSEIESLRQHDKKAMEYAKMMLAREELASPQARSEEREDPAVSLQKAIEQRFSDM